MLVLGMVESRVSHKECTNWLWGHISSLGNLFAFWLGMCLGHRGSTQFKSAFDGPDMESHFASLYLFGMPLLDLNFEAQKRWMILNPYVLAK